MRPFTEQIGRVKVGFAETGLPTVTVDGTDRYGNGTTARTLLSRSEAERLRDWLNDYLEDGSAGG